MYEFKNVSVCSVSKFNGNTLEKLSILGKALKATNRFSTKRIELGAEIDKILVREYNRATSSKISLEFLIENLENVSR